MKNKLKSLVKEELTTYEIAERLGKSRQTIMSWLKKYGLKTKFKRGQTKNTYKPLGNTNLRKSCWEIQRPLGIKRLWLEYPERDECERCGSKRNLQIHHKNENRKDNKQKNIEILCRSCHCIIHDRGRHLPKDRGWSKRRR